MKLVVHMRDGTDIERTGFINYDVSNNGYTVFEISDSFLNRKTLIIPTDVIHFCEISNENA